MPIQTFKCAGCGKNRAENRFSLTTLRKYRSKQIELPRCTDCSNSSVHELRCARCDVVKGLDAFSKQMRRNPDNALCWGCSQDKQDLEPEHKDQVQEELAMDRIRTGATLTNLGASTAFSYGTLSRSRGQSNRISASTHLDYESDWQNPPIPIPDDPRARSLASSTGRRSPSIVSRNTYASHASAVTGTAWDQFELTNAPYREHYAPNRRISTSNSSQTGSNPAFVKQGAVKQDRTVKAQNTLARQQQREVEQAEQAILHNSDDDNDDDDSDEPY